MIKLTNWAGILGIFAAGVPGLGKNWLINRLGNLYSSTSFMVSSKSYWNKSDNCKLPMKSIFSSHWIEFKLDIKGKLLPVNYLVFS